jgi:REP element-mobilizing transposase RayT
MKYDPDKHHRKSIRLRGYDYTQAGAYFITICVQNRECVLGDIVNGEVQLSEWGQVVQMEWDQLPQRFPNIDIDALAIMPNHVHGIVVIPGDRSTARRAPTATIEQFGQPVPGSIPTVVRSFKSAITKRINELRGTPGVPFWQRNYWEHVVRDEIDLNRIRQYIENNPRRWHEDQLNLIVPPHPGGTAAAVDPQAGV